jgi:hypothetical protein
MDQLGLLYWDGDLECIEGLGSYAAIAHDMSRVTAGLLPIENVEDFVDDQSNTAWLAFTLNGQPYKWDLQSEDDWMDTRVLTYFVELLAKQNTEKRFAILHGMQDFTVTCVTPEELETLNRDADEETTFQWLE